MNRDRYTDKHKMPPRGVDTGHGVPEFVSEDITSQYAHDPQKLAEARRTHRSTGQRLAHLEEKYDRLVHAALQSRTKIIVALIGLATGVIGFLLGGGCQ
jgi:hypothetical protein